MSVWVECFLSIRFDLDVGPKVEYTTPPDALTEQGKARVISSAFPDCNPDCEHNFIFSFTMPDCTRAAAQSFSEVVADPSTGHTAPKIYGAAYYRQKKDPRVPRGYVQQVLVLLSRLPYFYVHELMLRVIAPRYGQCCPLSPDTEKVCISSALSPLPNVYYELDVSFNPEHYTQDDVLDAALKEVSAWPTPHPRVRYVVDLLNQAIEFTTPPHSTKPIHNQQFAVPRPEMLLDDRVNLLGDVTFGSTRASFSFEDLLPLYGLLGDHMHYLTRYWELVICHEPIFVLSNTPSTASASAFALASLVAPIRYNGVFSSYFTVQNEEFSRLSRMGKALPFPTTKGLIVAGTNPFFVRNFDGWPNLIVVLDPATKTFGATDQPDDDYCQRRVRSHNNNNSSNRHVGEFGGSAPPEGPPGGGGLLAAAEAAAAAAAAKNRSGGVSPPVAVAGRRTRSFDVLARISSAVFSPSSQHGSPLTSGPSSLEFNRLDASATTMLPYGSSIAHSETTTNNNNNNSYNTNGSHSPAAAASKERYQSSDSIYFRDHVSFSFKEGAVANGGGLVGVLDVAAANNGHTPMSSTSTRTRRVPRPTFIGEYSPLADDEQQPKHAPTSPLPQHHMENNYSLDPSVTSVPTTENDVDGGNVSNRSSSNNSKQRQLHHDAEGLPTTTGPGDEELGNNASRTTPSSTSGVLTPLAPSHYMPMVSTPNRFSLDPREQCAEGGGGGGAQCSPTSVHRFTPQQYSALKAAASGAHGGGATSRPGSQHSGGNARDALQHRMRHFFDSQFSFLLDHTEQTSYLMQRLEAVSRMGDAAQEAAAAVHAEQFTSSASAAAAASRSSRARNNSKGHNGRSLSDGGGGGAVGTTTSYLSTVFSEFTVADDIVRKFFVSLTAEFLSPITAWFVATTKKLAPFQLCDRAVAESIITADSFLQYLQQRHREIVPGLWTRRLSYASYKTVYERFARGSLFHAHVKHLVEQTVYGELHHFQADEWAEAHPSHPQRIDVFINLYGVVQRELARSLDPDIVFVTTATSVLAGMAVTIPEPLRDQFMVMIGELKL